MKLRSIMLSTGLLCAGALLGSGVRTGLADGIPAKDPLYYSGSLSEGGQLVNGQRTIGINLYTDQTTMTPFCQTVATNVEVVNGRFRVALAASCKGQINQNSSAWIEVIDGVTSVGRAKIGAVPYAVEADRASNASGLLASQITQLQGVVHSPSAFHAWVTTPVSIPGRVTFPVAFDHVEYDLAGEYNSTTGVFDPKQSGVYLVKCGFVLGPAPAAACAAVVLKNGSEVDARDVPRISPSTWGSRSRRCSSSCRETRSLAPPFKTWRLLSRCCHPRPRETRSAWRGCIELAKCRSRVNQEA